jgi:tetratricopeptide (TPR) repeat protein
VRRPLVLVLVIAGLAAGRDAAAQIPDDPARIAESARAAQTRYEKVRLRHLSTTWSRSGSSRDEIVGRIALINDAGLEEWRPSPDPAPVADARADLLAALDRAAARLPGDGWITGQRVFYYLEAGNTESALAAARDCRGDGWWCRALVGWALHAAGEFVASESAFREALAAMPPKERDRWTDLGPLLDDDSARLFKDGPDEARSRLERRYWWLADPLWSLPGNDRLTEHYARLVQDKVLEDARTPFEMSWGSDLREVLIRYGWPVGWERTRARSWALGKSGGGGIIGHDPPGERRFAPDAAMLERPTESAAGALTLDEEGARTTYSPAYAERFLDLDHQLAVFRRGQLARVVAGWSLPADSLAGSPEAPSNDAPVEAAVAVSANPADLPVLAWMEGRRSSGTLAVTVPWAPAVVSVEALSLEAGLAARARYGLPITGPSGARPALSDLLLIDPAAPLPRSLEEAVPRARGTTRLDPGASMGVFWELYPPGGGPYQVRWSLRLRDDRGGFWKGLGAALGLASRAGGSTALEWVEPVPGGLDYAPRTLVLTLPELPPGDYALELEAVFPDSRRARVERPIVVE